MESAKTATSPATLKRASSKMVEKQAARRGSRREVRDRKWIGNKGSTEGVALH